MDSVGQKNDLDFDFSLNGPETQNITNTTQKNLNAQKSQPQPAQDLENQSQTTSQSSPSTSQNIQVNPNEKIDITNFLQHANNPGVVFFTLFFKALAILFFLVLGIFGVPEALIFILVVILNSLDFWFVKNVSGRILVGLRWWNEVKEDGSEKWIFESDHENRGRSIDTTVFWMSLYATPIFWGIFVILELIGLKFMWFLACLIGFILTFSNTFGYYKCSGEQKKKIKGLIANKTQEGFTKILQFGASTIAKQQGL